MRGYVVKKRQRWYAVVYEGIDPATGKERRRWVAAGTRRSDAEKLVNQLVRRHHEGESVVPERITLESYLLDRWLPIQETRLKHSTFDSYRRNLINHVIPALGRRQLDKITVDDLDGLYAALLRKARMRGGEGTLSPRTVQLVHVTIHKALKDAHRKGLVVRNVADAADAPSASAKGHKGIRAWEADQLRVFLEAVR